MSLSADALYKMSDVELLAAYVEARRQFVEKKFARDTNRARLEWIRAKMYTGGSGGVTERNMAIDVSEETHAGRSSSTRTDYSGRGRQAVDFGALLFRESMYSANDDEKLAAQPGRLSWPFLSRNSSRFCLGAAICL